MFDIILSTCPPPVPNAAGWSDLVKTIASVVALPLAGLTFWLGYRQRERERTLAYYHKVAVDTVLQDIMDEVNNEIERLEQAGRDALEGLNSERKTMPRVCSIALADFAQDWFNLQDKITERTIIFDEVATEQIRLRFEETQDEITTWFNEISLHKRRDLEEIIAILRTNQRRIIKILYRGRFRDF